MSEQPEIPSKELQPLNQTKVGFIIFNILLYVLFMIFFSFIFMKSIIDLLTGIKFYYYDGKQKIYK
jgi:hypothetical protein